MWFPSFFKSLKGCVGSLGSGKQWVRKLEPPCRRSAHCHSDSACLEPGVRGAEGGAGAGAGGGGGAQRTGIIYSVVVIV